MDTALSAALAAARAAYVDFGAKLEALEALMTAPPVVEEPPPVAAPPPAVGAPVVVVPVAAASPKTVNWEAGAAEMQKFFAATGRWETITVYADGTREGPAIPAAPVPVAAPVEVAPAAPPASPLAPAPVVEAPVVAAPVKAGSGLAMAQAFHRKSVFNINWERERFARFNFDATVRDNYKDVGIGGVRGFIPWRPGGEDWGQFWDLDKEKAPTKDQFNRFRPNAKAITDAGLILMLDLLDEVPMSSFNDSRLPGVKQYLKDACGWIKEWQIDPALLCVGPVNEYRGEDNAAWEPLRFAFDAILQAELGDRYLLGMMPAYWGHHSSFTSDQHGKYNPGPNLQRIHFWHAYDRNSAEGWAGVQAGINGWSKANGGRVVMCGEVGPGGLYDGKDFSANDGGWVEHINRQNPALAESVPNLWACTDGDWTMNRGYADARLWVKDKGWEPEIEKAVRRAVAANRKARGL